MQIRASTSRSGVRQFHKSKVGANLYQAGSCSQSRQGVEEPNIPGTINGDLSDWRIMRAVRKQVREDIDLLKESKQDPLIVRHRVTHQKLSPPRETTVL